MSRQWSPIPSMSRLPRKWRHAPILGCAMPAVFVLTLLLAACQGSGVSPGPSPAAQSASSVHATRSAITAPPFNCSGSDPCQIAAGTYQLGPGTLLPGLKVIVPARWAVTENTPGEFSLMPPGLPNDGMKFWLDMQAVKSSGPGHGTTLLKNVGTTPAALISWLTRDPDFLIVSKPAPATVGHGIAMMSLVVGVSRSAHYGDPACPANPRCADLFTNRYWGSSASYGIGGNGQVRLYLDTIHLKANRHTFLIAFDADTHADLLRLEKAAIPILASLRLPDGTTAR